MKRIVKRYLSLVLSIAVFCIMLELSYNQGFNNIQAYGVSLIFGVISNIVFEDLIDNII